jgi:hypothetical protein
MMLEDWVAHKVTGPTPNWAKTAPPRWRWRVLRVRFESEPESLAQGLQRGRCSPNPVRVQVLDRLREWQRLQEPLAAPWAGSLGPQRTWGKLGAPESTERGW